MYNKKYVCGLTKQGCKKINKNSPTFLLRLYFHFDEHPETFNMFDGFGQDCNISIANAL